MLSFSTVAWRGPAMPRPCKMYAVNRSCYLSCRSNDLKHASKKGSINGCTGTGSTFHKVMIPPRHVSLTFSQFVKLRLPYINQVPGMRQPHPLRRCTVCAGLPAARTALIAVILSIIGSIIWSAGLLGSEPSVYGFWRGGLHAF